ncbi:cytochrome c biogenesis CcdA family protein [Rarobacter faecitabidus]|uniref:Cytochrome c biogenesis protein CcdA n=1 Tax=Rarobacter faecitabidus TaxID=13243 RepID=A0A542ZTZ2_RARFA|nr:cytochrome c biogenesis protein CcdA [Rarobacter faecitabidus]TQL63828.1 cytochrome c biogenesis protein CcdA [Rarobacter faecitabidus]
MDIGIIGALAGGLLTLLSPCSALLLPAFFAYAFTSPGRLLERTGIFYLGLITTLVPLGVLAGSVGAYFGEHRSAVIAIAAIAVIVFGALQVINIPLPGGRTLAGGTTPLAVYALGVVYGIASVCAGPILGTVLAVAVASASALYGGIVLLSFAAGMVIPLLLLALLWTRLPSLQRLVRPRGFSLSLGPVTWTNTWTQLAGGVFTIALGVLLLVTEGTALLPSPLTSGQHVRLESAVLDATSAVPNSLVIAVALVLLAAGIAGRIAWSRRIRSGSRATASD